MPQFTSASDDASSKITVGALKLSEPFTDLGFDTLAKKVFFNSRWILGFVTRDSHIVHLGRPLFGSHYDAGNQEDIVMFAVGKLINADPNTQEFTVHQKLAWLSQRLPIQFNSTTYISHTSEMEQVAEHLRVCLKVDATLESMETISPSEPLLSEATYIVMARKSFRPLKSILEGFAIHQGDHGKNGHPKHRFFSFPSFVYGNLFKASMSSTQSTVSALKMLKQDFPNATMHFNHFIKLHDYKSVNKKLLLFLMTRGAGVLCANSQASVDAINVFLISGTELRTDNLGVVLYQIKSNADYKDLPESTLFDSMDAYDLKILEPGDKSIPVIRIFFALASSLHVTRHPPSSSYCTIIYDIWSAGLSSDFLDPITSNTDIWNALLQASYGWKAIYKAKTDMAKELRRSMNPGAADDDGHWSHWAARSSVR